MNGSERAQVEEIARRLEAADRPLILARPSAARGMAGEHLAAIAAALGIAPIVIEAPRGLADLKYASISARFPESDCALIVGPPDFALGFLARTHLASAGSILLVDAAGDPAPSQPVDLHLRADTLAVLAQLRSRLPGTASAGPAWSALWPLPAPPEASGAPTAGVHPLAVSAALRAALGSEDVVVLDGGEFCQWIRLGLRDMPNPVLWNGKVGAIGGAIPMSVGAAVAAPGRRIVAVMGDGGAGYHLSEFETMDRYGLAITALIGNDARWAAEWHLQIARYGPERTIETELTNARYERVAMGFNAAGEHITDAAELPEALHEALGRRGATCLNVEVAALPSPAAMS